MNIKKFVLVLTVFVFISFTFHHSVFAETIVDADIDTDTTWTISQSPYIVTASVAVLAGVTLTIEPGVVVKFDTYTGIFIEGKLLVNGTVGNKIIFTSLRDDTALGDTNADGAGTMPAVANWQGIVFSNTADFSNMVGAEIHYADFGLMSDHASLSISDIILSNINDGILAFASHITASNISLNNIADDATLLFDASTMNVNNLSINNVVDDATLLFDASTMNVNNLSINNVAGSGVLLFNASSMDVNNFSLVSLTSRYDAIGIFSDSNLILNNASTAGSVGRSGVMIFDGGSISIDNSIISGFKTGISDFGGGNFGSDFVTIKNSQIKNNNVGIALYANDSILAISKNTIHDNSLYGAQLLGKTSANLKNNFWGDPSGPYNDPDNLTGLGNAIEYFPGYNTLLFKPFLTSWPQELDPAPSVLFIPGFKASREYKTKSILGITVEDQLWEPQNNADVRDLFMNKNGQSVDNTIYTKDVIGNTNVPLGVPLQDIYQSFFDSMNTLKSTGEITDWKAVPYDWRFSPDDLVNKGTERADGTISFIDSVPSGQLPYIIDQLKKLTENQNTGKITIVTHSNGGLIAKALVKKLLAMKNAWQNTLADKIDKVIMIAPPSVGTPEALAGLLHGTEQGLGPLNIILSEGTSRTFGENLPSAYGLLPSSKYFSTIENSPIIFDPSVDKANNFRKVYGDMIDSFTEMKRFLTGSGDKRQKPQASDLESPNILNGGLIDKAKTLHDSIDNFNFPSSMKVYQLAGWGLGTIKNIKYSSKEVCLVVSGNGCSGIGYELEPSIEITSDGDKTVVSPSASFGNNINYYFNMKDWNGNNFFNQIKHKNIFKAGSISEFVQNILSGSTTLPNYVTTTKPQAPDNLVISMHSPMTLDVYDGEGNHTGIVTTDDPEVSYIEENITNSSYFVLGDQKYAVLPKGNDYIVKMSGLDFGTFTLKQETLIADKSSGVVSFVDLPATPSMQAEVSIGSDSIGDMAIDADGDGNFELDIQPQAEFDPILYLETLKQTIKSFGLSPKAEKDLLKKIDNLEKIIQKGKIKNASKKVQNFTKRLELGKKHVFGKKLTKEQRDEIVAKLNELLDNIK